MNRTEREAYRAAVVAVFLNERGQVLLCERMDAPGVWELPQGELEPNESDAQALRRSMRDEIGSDRFDIVRASGTETRCVYPRPSRYFGRSLRWYLLRFRHGVVPDGFREVRWVTPEAVIDGATPWERAAYADGLAELGLTFMTPGARSTGANPTAS